MNPSAGAVEVRLADLRSAFQDDHRTRIHEQQVDIGSPDAGLPLVEEQLWATKREVVIGLEFGFDSAYQTHSVKASEDSRT